MILGSRGRCLTLLIVLAVAFLTSSAYSYSTAENSVATGILSLYNVTRVDLSTFLSQIGGSQQVMKYCATPYMEANASLDLADKYAKAAEVSLQSSNERLGETNALKALNLLGSSYLELISCISKWRIDAIEEPAPAPIYDVMRHELRLERLKSVVIAMESEGRNTTHLEELILQAERNLSKARISGLSGDLNGTAHYLKIVDRVLSDLVESLKSGGRITETTSSGESTGMEGKTGEGSTSRSSTHHGDGGDGRMGGGTGMDH